MVKKLKNYIAVCRDWYHIYKKELPLAKNIKIQNIALAKELEHHGTLTYAEYLTLTQFGKHGFYNQSNQHGQTDIDRRWGNALARYCQEQDYTTVIEFGCGTGELGAKTAKAYKKQTQKDLSWIGIERDLTIHSKILRTFESHNIKEAVTCVTETIKTISPRNHTLIVFPYSLDNIAPNIFINTNQKDGPPNALLGIQVKNGFLSEVILQSKKERTIQNGQYTQQSNTFNLHNWKLKRGQRAYIAIDAFSLLLSIAKNWKENAHLLIIDEFRQEPWEFSLNNRGVPRSLYEHNLFSHDRRRHYQESGRHNYYYPMYPYTLTKFLHNLGFQSVKTEIEQKLAAKLQDKTFIPIKKYYATLACIAENWTPKDITQLTIPFSPKRLLER